MGLFGRKKTPEDLLAEGRAQYESGDMRHMFLTLHGLANKGNPEACYYIGVYWLREKSDRRMAEKYLTTAAQGGHAGAAKLLAEQFGAGDFLPQAPEPAPAAAPVSQPAPQPAPVPVPQPKEGEPSADDLLEELEETGKLIQETKRELRQAEKKMGGVGEISRPKPRASESAPTWQSAPASTSESAPERQSAAAPVSESAPERQSVSAPVSESVPVWKLFGISEPNDDFWDEDGEAEEETDLCWYERAAERGDSNAQILCASMYYEGDGTAVDKKKALYWYEKAAEQGNADVQYICAVMYYNGEGTAVDKKKALYWYEQAAALGNVKAQYFCAAMYFKGEGTAVNWKKALYWYEEAAELGHVNAQCDCGLMYYNGEGTAVNKKKAKMWFEKAAAQTDDEAGQERAMILLREFFNA